MYPKKLISYEKNLHFFRFTNNYIYRNRSNTFFTYSSYSSLVLE